MVVLDEEVEIGVEVERTGRALGLHVLEVVPDMRSGEVDGFARGRVAEVPGILGMDRERTHR